MSNTWPVTDAPSLIWTLKTAQLVVSLNVVGSAKGFVQCLQHLWLSILELATEFVVHRSSYNAMHCDAVIDSLLISISYRTTCVWGRLFRCRSWGRFTLTDCSSNRLNRLNWSRRIVVGLEHFQSPQLLVDQGQRLKLLRLRHLLFEPSLRLVLFDLLQVRVVIVDMSMHQSGMPFLQRLYVRYAYLPVQLKKRQLLPLAMLSLSFYCVVSYHLFIANRTDQPRAGGGCRLGRAMLVKSHPGRKILILGRYGRARGLRTQRHGALGGR